MLLEEIALCKKFIKKFDVLEYDSYKTSFKIRASVLFISGDILNIRIASLKGSFFKYAYHWVTEKGNLLCRWDNAPHWPYIATYPHHKHLEHESKVVASREAGDLSEVMKIIADYYERK